MKASDIPNIITVLRILLVAPIMWLLANGQFGLVLLLFFVAAVSDGLDGYLARHYHWRSHLGAVLDPLADKFLLVGTYLVLGGKGLLPWWLVGLVILRDIVIVAGATAYHYFCRSLTMEPTMLSKTNTVLQILLGLLVITMATQWLVLPVLWLQIAIALVAISTVWSGVDYVWRWGRRAYYCYEQGEE